MVKSGVATVQLVLQMKWRLQTSKLLRQWPGALRCFEKRVLGKHEGVFADDRAIADSICLMPRQATEYPEDAEPLLQR